MRISALFAATLATFGFAQLAAAASPDTDTLAVEVTVEDSCVVTGAPLTFANYTTVSGATSVGSAAMTVACNNGAVATITLDEGAHEAGASFPATPLRRMSDGTHFLSYKLFTTAGLGTEWEGVTGVEYTALTSAASDQTVYGVIAASQDAPSGVYTDTVLATVAF